MPSSFMTLFPGLKTHLEFTKMSLQSCVELTDYSMNLFSSSMKMMRGFNPMAGAVGFPVQQMPMPDGMSNMVHYMEMIRHFSDDLLDVSSQTFVDTLKLYQQERNGELAFIRFLTEDPPDQDWTEEYEAAHILLDLPSLRLVDISREKEHDIQNYTVVFAPRAGHHSNIAERVALFLRKQGLTRVAVVEQKCAEEVPLQVGDNRHREGFDGQVDQYREVLTHLKERTGYPAHLVAVCQPGPLLMSTLILYPELGKTFGSAGSPMHTEAQSGFFTDFSRAMGEKMIDFLVDAFGQVVPDDQPGAGRKVYDGRVHLLGFYFMGMDQHLRNFKKLLRDLKTGDEESARRQQAFYQWYNYVHHFPAGFIKDTYKKVFVRNDLMNDGIEIGERVARIGDYPTSVPIWALGGTKDEIAPPGQATEHLNMIPGLAEDKKLNLICEAGHMGLFRSRKILEQFYTRIAAFMLENSDMKSKA